MRIGILDTVELDRNCYVKWLKGMQDIEVEMFDNDQQLIAKAQASPLDLCIIRLGLAQISGLFTAKGLLELSSSIRIAFVCTTEAYVLDAFEIGACGYLLSPIEREKLESLVEKEKKFLQND